jgi:hypothetical protein
MASINELEHLKELLERDCAKYKGIPAFQVTNGIDALAQEMEIDLDDEELKELYHFTLTVNKKAKLP